MTRLVRRDERGNSTIYTLLIVPVLMLVVGLVVDGGGKIASARTAQAHAAAAARAAGDASALSRAAGKPGTSEAYTAARRWLAVNHVSGTVTSDGRMVTVTTTATYTPVFLSAIGVTSMTSHGQATTDLRGVR